MMSKTHRLASNNRLHCDVLAFGSARLSSGVGPTSQSCQFLPLRAESGVMSTMNISLPDTLKSFVDSQVADGGYGTSSEYVRELIRRDQDRLHLRKLILEGAQSPKSSSVMDKDYFSALRIRATTGRKRK